MYVELKNMYWYLNKQTNTPLVFSSLVAIEKELGIPIDRLKYHFSRLKRKRYEDDTHRIEKVPLISSKKETAS